MKEGFLAALSQAALGHAPVPGEEVAGGGGLTELHEQLLASIQEREGGGGAGVRTVPTAGPGEVRASSPSASSPPAGVRGRPAETTPSRLSGNRLRRVHQASGAASKGTIEEALGLPDDSLLAGAESLKELLQAGIDQVNAEGAMDRALFEYAREHVPERARVDPRASEDEQVEDHGVAQPFKAWPEGHPGMKPCPVCGGGGMLTQGRKVFQCGRCGGTGEVEEVKLAKPYAVVQSQPLKHCDEHPRYEDSCSDCWDRQYGPLHGDPAAVAVETALEAEAAGVQHLPLEVIEEAFLSDAEADEVLPSLHGAVLTYDLPTDLLELPNFCYVAGPAGTGKTFMAKAWAAQNPEGVILAATTGIAAVNLGEGTTINALLRYYDTASLAEAFTGGWLESQFARLRRAGLQRLVLDEVSMLDGDQLTILTRAIDNANQDRKEGEDELGLVLVGDFAQLSPVRAPYAFESAEWERYAKATYRLQTIRRQADKDFIEALQAVRRGDAARALDFFVKRLEPQTHPSFEGTTILAKNEAVEKYNQLRLDKVKGAPMQFASSRWGKLRSEWGGPPKPKHEWGVPESLLLKEGALVMILANRNIATKGDPPEYLYVNGDLGTVVTQERGGATVVLQRTGEEVTVVPINRENLIPLEPGRRKALKEEGHPERISQNGKQEIIGACSYMPMRLAYASTVHKSQGLSLDTVQVNIRDSFFSQPGMLYVALSRARTAEGLRLVGNEQGFRTRCTVSPKIKEWL